ncbi:MAG: mechanosensitive ion channel [Saprospiraceae bacterium]|nr:mechanosensitive ion channel [Saprospiraceae bacterium]
MDYLDQVSELIVAYAPRVLGAIVTILIGFWLASFLASKLKRRLQVNPRIDPSLTPFLVSLVAIFIKILVLLSAASMFGLEVTSFVAILGALAFAVGLALQGNLSHMASGILILFFRPFKVGDFIVTQGYSGTVSEIQIFNTLLVTLDNRVIIIPNGAITSNAIENLSMNPTRKVPMTFGISYEANIDLARKIIQEVADECPLVDHSQPVDIWVSELADSSVNFAVRPWCKTEDYWKVYGYMHEYIKKAFDRADIGIPYPQMDIHMNKLN